MSPVPLYPPPSRLLCYVCGKFTESPSGWNYRVRRGKYSAVCASCTPRVLNEIELRTTQLNLPGAIGLGAAAAVSGSVAWYVVASFAIGEGMGGWLTVEFLAIVAGLLVAKAVMLGSGNKCGLTLQIVSVVLSTIPLIGGRYLLLNHLMSTHTATPEGWLTPSQFVVMYGRLLLHGAAIVDIPFLALSVICSAALPIPDKLFSELPPWAHK